MVAIVYYATNGKRSAIYRDDIHERVLKTELERLSDRYSKLVLELEKENKENDTLMETEQH